MRRIIFAMTSIALIVSACGGKSAFDLAVGDCFDDPSNFDNVETVPERACSEPHDNEVYANLTMPGSDWPGSATVENWADEACYQQFESYVGTSYEESALYFSWLIPTERSWDQVSDRTVTCILYDAEFEKLTGSMQSSGV